MHTSRIRPTPLLAQSILRMRLKLFDELAGSHGTKAIHSKQRYASHADAKRVSKGFRAGDTL